MWHVDYVGKQYGHQPLKPSDVDKGSLKVNAFFIFFFSFLFLVFFFIFLFSSFSFPSFLFLLLLLFFHPPFQLTPSITFLFIFRSIPTRPRSPRPLSPPTAPPSPRPAKMAKSNFSKSTSRMAKSRGLRCTCVVGVRPFYSNETSDYIHIFFADVCISGSLTKGGRFLRCFSWTIIKIRILATNFVSLMSIFWCH